MDCVEIFVVQKAGVVVKAGNQEVVMDVLGEMVITLVSHMVCFVDFSEKFKHISRIFVFEIQVFGKVDFFN